MDPVAIYQFLPNPTNEDDEYIELHNPNTDVVDISGYQLDDEPNAGSKPYFIPAGKTIPANGHLKFTKSETKIALNNSKQKDQPFADMVRLLSRDGQELDTITYSVTDTDIPIGHVVSTPTPNPPTTTAVPTHAPTKTPPTITPSPKPALAATAEIIPTTIPRPTNSRPTISPDTIPIPLQPKKSLLLPVFFIIAGLISIIFSFYLLLKKISKR